MESKATLYLVDGTANIYRAYHAIRNLSTSKGFPSNAIYGFTAMLLKIFQEQHPTHLCMVYDPKGPTFRHDMYDQYKATRPGMPDDLVIQLPYIKQIAEGLGVHALEIEGYEADDVIGSLARRASAAHMSTVIVSGDKDFCQLVNDDVTIYDPRTNKTIGIDEVRDLFGVDPAQVIDVMGLAGDAGDNVPGVAGIGRKTAAQLIQRFHSIDNVYEQLEAVTPSHVQKKLAQAREIALLSRDLVTIDTNVPLTFDLDKLRVAEPDKAVLEPLFRELEFIRFIKEFTAKSVNREKRFVRVETEEALIPVIEEVRKAGTCGFVVDTTPGRPLEAELTGIALSCKPHRAYFIPCGGDTFFGLSRDSALKTMKPLFEDAAIGKTGHDTKQDFVVLRRHGIEVQGVTGDTMIASYLLNPSRRNHVLEDIAVEWIGEHLPPPPSPKKKKGNIVAQGVSEHQEEWHGSCRRAEAIARLRSPLAAALGEKSLARLFTDIELPLATVLGRMELAGIKVDSTVLQKMSQETAVMLQDLEGRIYALAGEEFNINSPQQLGTILFEKLDLPVISKTKTGYSTSVSVLTTLAESHKLPSLVLEYRRYSKLRSTYIDVLPRLIDRQTGRVHTTFNQTVTATGRLSSSDPNLQNIPIRGEWGRKIRQAFVGEPGMVLVSADYSQIELRVMAHLSKDENLLEAFISGQDVHTRTAAELFQVSPEAVTSEMRRKAKIVNFGVMYGMSHMGLAQELGISRGEAKDYIDTYFLRYQGVYRFIHETLERAREQGSVETLSGRIRYVPEIGSRNRMVREATERIAVNTPIQGTAADVIKVAMLAIDERLRNEDIDGQMILQIHDELVFEVSDQSKETLMAMVKEEMEGAMALDVPLKASVHWGKNWDEAH